MNRVRNRSKLSFELGSRGKTGTSGFGPGPSENIRILRYFTWILRTWKSISHVLILFAVPKRYYTIFSPFLSPSRALPFPLALNPKSFLPNPFQGLRELQSAWGILSSKYSTLGWFHFSSFLAREAYSRYQKLGLNGLVVLGCFKRFLFGQSSPYESLY